MSLPKFNSKIFKGAVFGAGAAAMLMVGPAAHAENNEVCLPLDIAQSGETINSSTSAMRYSDDNKGAIAISAFPGADLHNSAEQLTNYFESVNSDAACFVNNSLWPNRGSVISLYVAGLPVSYKGQESFGLKELRANPEILQAARDEALMARIAFASLQKDLPSKGQVARVDYDLNP